MIVEPRDKRRKRRKPKNTALIVGDGQTEQLYFESLNERHGRISIISIGTGKTGINQSIRIAKGAVKHRQLNTGDGDLVAIVMDIDGRYDEEDIAKMYKKCEEKGYSLFLSNPCIEIWFLLHYEGVRCECTQHEALHMLEVASEGKYSKTRAFEFNNEMLEGAMKRAEKILPTEECCPSECLKRNPSTMLHVLVCNLLNRPEQRYEV